MTTENTEAQTENPSHGASVAVQPVVMCDADRIALLQYKSLRENFSKLVGDVLGSGYYNMGMDVYECDRIACEDIAMKANRSWWEKLLNT